MTRGIPLIVLVVALLSAGCATRTVMRAGRFEAWPSEYRTAYHSDREIYLTYTAIYYEAHMLGGAWTPKRLTNMWAVVSKADVLERERAKPGCVMAAVEDIHFGNFAASDLRTIPILRNANTADVPRDASMALYAEPVHDGPIFHLFLRDKSDSWAHVRIKGIRREGRKPWGYPVMMLLIPLSLPFDIVTAPFQWFELAART